MTTCSRGYGKEETPLLFEATPIRRAVKCRPAGRARRDCATIFDEEEPKPAEQEIARVGQRLCVRTAAVANRASEKAGS